MHTVRGNRIVDHIIETSRSSERLRLPKDGNEKPSPIVPWLMLGAVFLATIGSILLSVFAP